MVTLPTHQENNKQLNNTLGASFTPCHAAAAMTRYAPVTADGAASIHHALNDTISETTASLVSSSYVHCNAGAP